MVGLVQVSNKNDGVSCHYQAAQLVVHPFPSTDIREIDLWHSSRLDLPPVETDLFDADVLLSEEVYDFRLPFSVLSIMPECEVGVVTP